jgi:glucosamine--fructose-6-phosphate aminotransferase (isomerizing)
VQREDPGQLFLAQVAEQPHRLSELIEYYSCEEGRARLLAWREMAQTCGDVLFAGMGTSEHAPYVIKHLLMDAGLRVAIEDAGEVYHYRRASLAHCSLPVLISQSGESIETKRLAVETLADHPSIVVLTNDVQSTIARCASLVLPICAGYETAISTKTYVNTLALLYLMARSLAGDDVLGVAIDDLHQVAKLMASSDPDGVAREAASFLFPLSAIQFVARGPTMAAARQAALTFMEGAKLPSAALTAGAFRHGPLELSREGHRVVFLAPSGRTLDITLGLAQECAQNGSRVLVFSDVAVGECTDSRLFVIRVPRVGEVLFSLAVATSQALLLHHLALLRGFVAGTFDHGSKVTTRE